MAIQIEPAYPDQSAALAHLLAQNHMDSSDLPAGLTNFWLALDNNRIIGSIGIESYDTIGLLRSVCVDAEYRNQGIARRLYNLARQEAQRQGIQDIYLLTTTADKYFEQLDFERIDRTDVPDAIQQTSQFCSLCPSSAIVMKQKS